MPLTLRPTRLSRNPHAKDWTVHDDDGQEIDRLYEDPTASRPGDGLTRWCPRTAADEPNDDRI
jgi:hypothetical protein